MPDTAMVKIQLRMRLTPKNTAACSTDFNWRGRAK